MAKGTRALAWPKMFGIFNLPLRFQRESDDWAILRRLFKYCGISWPKDGAEGGRRFGKECGSGIESDGRGPRTQNGRRAKQEEIHTDSSTSNPSGQLRIPTRHTCATATTSEIGHR